MNFRFAAIALVFLLFLQLVYGFLFPSAGFSDNWQPISAYLPKFQIEDSDDLILSRIYPLISSNYRLNSDSGHYLELGRNFSSEYFNGSPFLERPLYPFLIFFTSLPFRIFSAPSYGIVFGLAILVNFILISAGVLLFFFLLQRLFSLKTAWLSSILLIFSPFVHSYLNQPLAEMLMAFAVVAAAYLLHNYISKPSFLKLIIFSLLIGALMLGKMFFAVSFFVLLLAVYFRRYKEGAIFFMVHLVPFLLWYLWVAKVWRLAYYSHQVKDWDMGIWVFKIFAWPWHETYQVFLGALPNFITALFYAFLIIPVIFSVIGFRKLPFKEKNIFYFGSILSVLALGFLAKFYYLRHVFLLFPIIYPTAVLGMEKAASYFRRSKPLQLLPCWVFYVIVIVLMSIVSNINIYQIFDYNN